MSNRTSTPQSDIHHNRNRRPVVSSMMEDASFSTDNGTCQRSETSFDQTGVSDKDHKMNSSGQTSHMILDSHYEEKQKLEHIAAKYDMNQNFSRKLRQLAGFDIVFVCDDSGSMDTPLDGTQQTRWQYLMDFVISVLEIAVIFDSDGVDIYFLNRGKAEGIKDSKQVHRLFAEKPSGYTPLVPVLQKVFRLPAATVGYEKKLLVFVATDGAPTDERGNDQTQMLEKLMNEKRNADTTFVQFLTCTDESEQIKYLTDWDHKMKNVDVTRDICRERTLVKQAKGNDHSFAKGDYMIKALLGAVDPEIDKWNET